MSIDNHVLFCYTIITPKGEERKVTNMKYMNITVTTYTGHPEYTRAVLFYDDDEADIHLQLHLSYEEGMRELHKLEQKLGKKAEHTINRYDDSITYDELHGIIE